jgi:hypothetical protein
MKKDEEVNLCIAKGRQILSFLSYYLKSYIPVKLIAPFKLHYGDKVVIFEKGSKGDLVRWGDSLVYLVVENISIAVDAREIGKFLEIDTRRKIKDKDKYRFGNYYFYTPKIVSKKGA